MIVIFIRKEHCQKLCQRTELQWQTQFLCQQANIYLWEPGMNAPAQVDSVSYVG